MTADRIDLTLANRLDELERLAEAVDEFCDGHDLPPRAAFQFNLCFDELVTNVVTHGLPDAPEATIRVSLALEGDWIWGEIVDEGPAFDPFSAPPPDLTLDVEDRPIGGLGVHFLKTVMDDVRYERRGNRNHCRFGKKLADAPAA